jgi:hypothetical protein
LRAGGRALDLVGGATRWPCYRVAIAGGQGSGGEACWPPALTNGRSVRAPAGSCFGARRPTTRLAVGPGGRAAPQFGPAMTRGRGEDAPGRDGAQASSLSVAASPLQPAGSWTGHRFSVVTSAHSAQARIAAAASMNLYGALGEAKGKRRPYLQHPFGSRGGSLAPFGGMRGFSALPEVRRGAEAGVDQAAGAGRRNVGEPLIPLAAAWLNRLWPSGRWEVRRLVVCFRGGDRPYRAGVGARWSGRAGRGWQRSSHAWRC